MSTFDNKRKQLMDEFAKAQESLAKLMEDKDVLNADCREIKAAKQLVNDAIDKLLALNYAEQL